MIQTQSQRDFEEWIKQYPHLSGGNSFTKYSTNPSEYDSSWMQSTFEAYQKIEKNKEVLEYCRPHTDQMWAAKIVSIILGCDFRDATPTLAKYFTEIEK